VHAAALFALGEAASGAAMAGTLGPAILEVRPVASGAQIQYLKPANGIIAAKGRLDGDAKIIVTELMRDGKVRFNILVTLYNEAQDVVCEMQVEWHVRLKSK
jgi:acyl-coenzyme A thioesterase PaaI-like protein